MGKSELCISVPSFFRCPISLDIMKSPVSLSTGVTYDRAFIQKWLDEGHDTCPATMQTLPTREFVPNYTLRRLIQIWSASNQIPLPSDQSPSSSDPITREQIDKLLEGIKDASSGSLETLKVLLQFVSTSGENKDMLLKSGAVEPLSDVLKNAEAPELVLKILGLLPHTDETRRVLVRPQILTSIVEIIKRGNLEAKTESIRLLETLAVDGEMKVRIAAVEGISENVLRLCLDETTGETALKCLETLSRPKRNRLKLISLGVVDQMTKILEQNSKSCVARALSVLEMISACTEGRICIASNHNCVRNVVQKLLKISDAATEHCVAILWMICYRSPDDHAREVVLELNVMARLLLLLQSNCSACIRQMTADLLKVFRRLSKSEDNAVFFCYESKTTHISPF